MWEWILLALAACFAAVGLAVAVLGGQTSADVSATNDTESETTRASIQSAPSADSVLCVPLDQLPVKTLGRSGAVRSVRARLMPEHEWVVIVEDRVRCELAEQDVVRRPVARTAQRTAFGVRVPASAVRSGTDAALWAPLQLTNEPWPELSAEAL